MVGVAKWSAERAFKSSESDFLFPRYCSYDLVKSNSASVALNKWLQTQINPNLVVHSLRHAFRDRLRAIGCPIDLNDQSDRWGSKDVGGKYGLGHNLNVKVECLRKIVLL